MQLILYYKQCISVFEIKRVYLMCKFKCKKYDPGFLLHAIYVSHNIKICNEIKTTWLQLYLKTTSSRMYNSCIHFLSCLCWESVCVVKVIFLIFLYTIQCSSICSLKHLRNFMHIPTNQKTYLPKKLDNINPFLQHTLLFTEFCIVINFKTWCCFGEF